MVVGACCLVDWSPLYAFMVNTKVLPAMQVATPYQLALRNGLLVLLLMSCGWVEPIHAAAQ